MLYFKTIKTMSIPGYIARSNINMFVLATADSLAFRLIY